MPSLLPSLTELSLFRCTKLKSFPEGGLPSSIEKLKIALCDGIESPPEGGFPSNLKELHIWGCDKLVANRNNWGLGALPSLLSLRLESCKGVESFPEERLLPSSLNSLQLLYLRQLKSLDYKGLQHLSSLTELKLWGCTELHYLPEEGLPSSLEHLELWDCHHTLVQRCQEGGEDWPMISHIPKIKIH
ncbi:hypothetical protein Tsubulata_019646 [Turnera subulata]|uniref:NB-ARC domain-containing protein n=1 Tax=Turnera subulata TaxID=218843 RepID=A0A9Q0JC15_9ROSI|nr:hypothetical protein Tsubulata_019646 [Turnera subulata]